MPKAKKEMDFVILVIKESEKNTLELGGAFVDNGYSKI